MVMVKARLNLRLDDPQSQSSSQRPLSRMERRKDKFHWDMRVCVLYWHNVDERFFLSHCLMINLLLIFIDWWWFNKCVLIDGGNQQWQNINRYFFSFFLDNYLRLAFEKHARTHLKSTFHPVSFISINGRSRIDRLKTIFHSIIIQGSMSREERATDLSFFLFFSFKHRWDHR